MHPINAGLLHGADGSQCPQSKRLHPPSVLSPADHHSSSPGPAAGTVSVTHGERPDPSDVPRPPVRADASVEAEQPAGAARPMTRCAGRGHPGAHRAGDGDGPRPGPRSNPAAPGFSLSPRSRPGTAGLATAPSASAHPRPGKRRGRQRQERRRSPAASPWPGAAGRGRPEAPLVGRLAGGPIWRRAVEAVPDQWYRWYRRYHE